MIHTVSALTRYVKTLVEGDRMLQNVCVRGELSNFKKYPSGHCYFTMKDAASCLKCVMFRSRADSLRFVPQNGMQVIVSGSVAVYERDGVYQLYADRMTPDGVGDLALAYEQLKDRLAAEGLFDAAYKKPLPFFPTRIGIVTSLAGAVLRDIHRVAKRRFRGIQLLLAPVIVQGEGAAGEIAQAIRFFNERVPVDVLIVGRGGGSMEDLWAFNEEPVVRAIFASRIPVISAVGHETDFTLSDFASDVRAATPSQAAELAVPDAAELLAKIGRLRMQMERGRMRILQSYHERLRSLSGCMPLSNPQRLLAPQTERLDSVCARFCHVSGQMLSEKRHRLDLLLGKLDALNPARVLRRGYAAVERDGSVLCRARDIAAGDALTIVFQDGRVSAHVD